jgi:predicted HicB family RNase H-like nuclease
MKVQLISERQTKSKQLNLRVTPDEHRAIYHLCRTHGLSKGEFIRKAVNEYAEKHYSQHCKAVIAV